jgi:hypothetical protein
MSDVFQVYGTLRAKVFDEERDYQIIGTTPGGLVGNVHFAQPRRGCWPR